jgi:hypothetical protein
MRVHLQGVNEDIDMKKTLKWKNFKRYSKRMKLHEMKRTVDKWLGKGKSDIRGKKSKTRDKK